MRILYCNKYNFRFSGTESYLFETMELMRSHGHGVALFSMADSRGQPTAYDRHFVSHVDFKRGNIPAKIRNVAHAIYSVDARNKIRAMIRDFYPEVAHVRNIYHHLSPSILWELKSQGVAVLYHMNDLKLFCPSYNMVSASGMACGDRCNGGRFWHVISEGCYYGGRGAAAVLATEAYLHRWLRTYEKCVDLILAPSHFVKELLINNGWSSSKVEVLPHFQRLPLHVVPHPGPDAPILYFGRLSAEKGVADLIAAMCLVADMQLIIAGDGPLRPELERPACDRKLQNVTFAGHVTGTVLDDLIARSQFTVFPSRAYETFGKSILESYAQCRAVIASDLGSRRELVDQGRTGLLYEVANVEQLAATIKLLRARPDLARAMGEAGRESVRERHAPEQHVAALTRIYQRLQIQGRRRRVGQLKTPRYADGEPSAHSRPSLKIAYIGGRGVIGKYSGIETYYEQTGKRLAAMGHEVTIYCRTHFTPRGLEHNGMHIVRLPTIRTKHLETFIHTLLSTVHACFGRYDVVHYHTLGPALFSFVPRMFGNKTVVTVQGLDWQRKKWSWFARLVLRTGEWAAARLPNKTVVVSRTLRDYFHAHYCIDSTYIPNGTELREVSTGPYLQRLQLRPKEYALFLGRFSPEKNCDLLIDAFEKTETTMNLVLAGGSSHTDDYVARIRKRQTDRIKVLDWVSGDSLHELLTNAALFVLPSDMEGLSLSLLEAMGAGLCVLASDTPENREVIQDCGFTFRVGNVNDLEHMLTVLLNNATLRDKAGKRARMRVEQNYLWHQLTSQIEAVYYDVLGIPSAYRSVEAMRKSA